MSGLAQCICCSVCLIVVIAIISLILSFSSLPVNTYGLDYSPITKQINPNVFSSGYHYLGFMHKFIEYPSTQQTIEFSNEPTANKGAIEARSKDGLMVNFRAQFQYQLNQKDLLNLYNRYGEDYKTPCIRFAVDSLNDQASNYEASSFFKNLTQLQSEMQIKLTQVFLRECYSTVNTLQLSKADLPKMFEDALQATNVAIQESITVKQTQQNVIIEMQTQINQAQISAPIVVKNAEGKVNATVTTNKAKMEAFVKVVKWEADAYQYLKGNLTQMTDENFLEYLKVKAINEFNQKNLIIGEVDGHILHAKPKVQSHNSSASAAASTAATSTAIVNNAKFRSGSPF